MALDEEYRRHFSARLSRLRAEQGLTYAEVGKHCGVSHAAVQQWEGGLTSPGQSKRKALSDLFGESFDDSDVYAEKIVDKPASSRGRKKVSTVLDPAHAERAARLRQAREKAGFASAAAAALHLDIPYSSYAGHESGLRGFRRGEGEIYAKAFEVDLAWLELGQGSTLPPAQMRRLSGGSLHDRLIEERRILSEQISSLREGLADAQREMMVLDDALARLAGKAA